MKVGVQASSRSGDFASDSDITMERSDIYFVAEDGATTEEEMHDIRPRLNPDTADGRSNASTLPARIF